MFKNLIGDYVDDDDDNDDDSNDNDTHEITKRVIRTYIGNSA